MTDDIDRAQEGEQRDRERALARLQQRLDAARAPHDAAADGACIDCGEPIEPARLRVLCGKTSRCASCAHDHEQRARGYRQ